MLEVTYGQSSEPERARLLAEALSDQIGSLYLGYPVRSTPEERVIIDGLLVSKENGIVAFIISDDVSSNDLGGWDKVAATQDEVYAALYQNFFRHASLRQRRNLQFEINVVTIFPSDPKPSPNIQNDPHITLTSISNVSKTVNQFNPIQDDLRTHVEVALQAVTTMKVARRRESANKAGSFGNIQNEIEQAVSKLDQWQKQAALETTDGPQRIRGLSGSGKTIVLALKAAYLHATNPDWTIAVTFHTRSLYQQFTDLIRRFSFEFISDEPNWDKLRVRHAWGGANRDGIYTEVAEHVGEPIRNFTYGRTKFGQDHAFAGICNELLNAVSNSSHTPLYDAVLIDEAQDLPPEFFKIVYRFTQQNKMIIWAYDELQRLSESSMPTVAEMFGVNDRGESNVQLQNTSGAPRQDIVLKICYRNPSELIALAHSLGLGIYRDDGQIQGFDEPETWIDIGYELLEGELSPGSGVRLRRNPTSQAEFFEKLLEQDDIIQTQGFQSREEQSAWIAENIKRNLSVDQLRADDILIVLSDAYHAQKDAVLLSEALQRYDISSHLAGVTYGQDEIFRENSVAMANIYRSKGNEAAMVYIVDAQRYMVPIEQIRRRNALFTAITRSRAWVRLCGGGALFDKLQEEVNRVKKNHYQLKFKLLTTEELEEPRRIHRELTPGEREQYRKVESNARELIKAVGEGLSLDALPPDVRETLQRLFQQESQ